MQLIDTHSHIDLQSFAADFDAVLARSRENGVIAQILPGVYRHHWPNLLDVCRTEPDLFAAPGLHPMYLPRHAPEHLDELQILAKSNNIVALGEIGLDYYIDHIDRGKQQQLFEAQLHIAKDSDLPILLHVRKAHDQVQSILRRKQFGCGGIVHAFGGSLQQAQKYVELGFTIGIGGTITYDRARKIRAIARDLPVEALVLETDAPDIPPAPYHGQRNSPEYLPLILKSLAQIRNEDELQLAEATTRNALAVLRLEKIMPDTLF